MENHYQNEEILDGQNRCRRCDRPLSDPNDIYGWRCAKIVGLDTYNKIATTLDENALLLYNRYVSAYMRDVKETENTEKKGLLSKTSFFRPTDWRDASEIIKRNATAIKNAGAYYGVNPAIIAACIYTEQITNVNSRDKLTDVLAYFLDTSIGIGQVKVSTAKMLEDEGYIASTKYRSMETYAGTILILWDTPGYSNGTAYASNRNEAIAKRLTSESENINYVAAYLKYFQDRWKDVYPEIDGRTAVLATLFNLGENANPPNPNPKSIPFGERAKEEYPYMRQLLGLEE